MRGKADSTFLTTEKIRDHPRLCGEKFSPVLVRAIPDRITPAYAGKSAAVRYYAVATQDHPRLCGEKCNKWITSFRILGSPPPMRGKAKKVYPKDSEIRITPAYAGKSAHRSLFFRFFQDHPRLCGEKTGTTETLYRTTGSPPPMRGKEYFVTAHVIHYRITPAYAGKRILCHCSCHSLQDHPRLCGEKLFGGWDASIRAGSPPPMRGKGEDSSGSYFGTGITPAYAGKRARNVLKSIIIQGSPPPMRGKVHAFACFFPLCRITPAYAGKRWLAIWRQCYKEDHPRLCGEKSHISSSLSQSRDHPRLCGEKDKHAGWAYSDVGSPPPMRGKAHQGQ